MELPTAKPCPIPCPTTPGESDWFSSNSDDGFNICKNWERVAKLAKMCKEVATSTTSGTSEADPPPESNHPNSGCSESNEQELQEEGQGKGGDKDDEEDQDEDQDEEGSVLPQSSDLQHWTFLCTIHQLGP